MISLWLTHFKGANNIVINADINVFAAIKNAINTGQMIELLSFVRFCFYCMLVKNDYSSFLGIRLKGIKIVLPVRHQILSATW